MPPIFTIVSNSTLFSRLTFATSLARGFYRATTDAGLPGNKYYDLAKRYLPKGAGSVFTFGVQGGYEAGVKVAEGVAIFSLLANIGDTRSLILHPASTTHGQLTPEQREIAGAGDDVLRLSIGLETAADLIADLDRALERV